jgi:hypothetical protein
MSPRTSPGRNDPCPCGSGLKYKKCHLLLEMAEAAAAEPHRAPVHDAGVRLVERIGQWAHDRFGSEFKVADNDLGLNEMTTGLQFLVPWAIFHRPLRGMPAFEWFAREEAANISRRERELIDAQRQSWIGIWEVRESVPGKSMILADLLSGEKRLVQEASASRTLVARDVIVGRVVDIGDVSVIDGMHPNALPPENAAYTVEAVGRTLKTTLPISVARLREFAVSLLIVTIWKSAVEAYEERRRTPPRLQNTDGDPFRLTVDHYRFAPADRAAIEAAVVALKGASPIEENDDSTHSITFIKSGNRLHEHWESTTIGVVITSENELRIETNSTRRANALRKPIEKACRGLIIDHRRTQTDASELLASARDAERPLAAPEPMDADVQEVIRNQKVSHYESWLDTSIPALGGKTPKQAARNPRGRDALNALLKTIENAEAREPAAIRYDVNILRRALGIVED